MYYLARAANGKPLLNIAVSGLFVFYVLFIARGRVDLACLALALTYAVYTSRLYHHWRLMVAVAIVYGSLGTLIPQHGIAVADSPHALAPSEASATAKPEITGTLIGRSINDIAGLAKGQKAGDDGLNARQKSFSIVTGRMMESPALLLLGSGRVSNQWEGGFSGALGTWFYPPELGFIGAIFVYGLIVYLVFVPYSLLLASTVFKETSESASLVITALRWLLAFLIFKFIVGMPMFYPVQFYFTAFACLALARAASADSSMARP